MCRVSIGDTHAVTGCAPSRHVEIRASVFEHLVAARTTAEKILGRAAGDDGIRAGDTVEAVPDVVLSHENTFLVARSFHELGVERPWDPARVVVVLDHRTPANSAQTANVHAGIRKLVQEMGIGNFFDVGEGICHQLLIENRLARPGQLVLGADSHTLTAGAVGAFASGVGATEVAGVWATGSIWLKVPQTVRVVLRGLLGRGVSAKDLALHLVRAFGPSGADYRCVEFSGELLMELTISDRMVLCNMCAETGAKAAIVPADPIARVWYAGIELPPTDKVRSDPDARFERSVEVDASKLDPMVSGPHRIDAADCVDRFVGIRVDQAFVGSCTNGRLCDLVEVAGVLKGRKVARGCRLIVAPASRVVLQDAIQLGLVKEIVRAGGVLIPPGCGPCLGAHEGVLGPGEACISSSNRNFKGRMGSELAEIYLASPATVAASAVEGRIADPRGYLGEED